jgi:Arc/MetJ-type ribon-helix-helix transcriptional regulator
MGTAQRESGGRFEWSPSRGSVGFMTNMANKFLSNELEAEITERVRRGPWRSPDEFVRHSIMAADALSELQAAIAEGDAQIARGESTDGEAFLVELEAELDKKARRATEA